MAPYSDDEFESDVDEDIVAAEPSEAEMPRVSPATKVKPTPRVYQPVYPASPMTIAGGVSPNVSPSPGKSPGTNVFRGDEPARTRSGGSGETEEEAKEQTTGPVAETSARDAVAGVSATRRTPEEEEGSPVTKKATIDATSSPSPIASSPIASSKEKPPRARWIRPETHTKKNASVDANKRETAWAATGRARVPNRSTNPVEMRREFLARRRREAAANAPRTPGEARAATRVTQTGPRTDANAKKNAYENKNNQTRRYAGVARDAFGVHQRSFVPRVPARVVRADLRSGAPIFSRRAADALEASGARNVLAEERGPSSAGEDPSGGTPARTACFVAVAEPGRGGVFSAARGPASPYAPLPTHRTYAWYKQFGFAGKGASSSWGFNPKRADLFAAYAKASATRENPRRRHF